MNLDALASDIRARAQGRARFIFAIAGAPGAGKSTFADALLAALQMVAPGEAALLPMDGYHFDNALLAERGLSARKGAPQTFDVDGLTQDLERIRTGDREVIVPIFDRDLDLARAGARSIRPEHRVVIVEGNYLLLDQAPWSGLAPHFDRTLFLSVERHELRRRLVQRWLRYGLDSAAAVARAEENDLPNAEIVISSARSPDLVWRDEAVLP